MLKSSLWICILIGLIGLSACNKKDTSVTLDANDLDIGEVAASTISSAVTSSPTQTLVSNDDKITIVVNGQFQNELNNSEDWVESPESSSLTLLQHDNDSNITLAVNNLGQAKLKASDYFRNLADKLKSNDQLTDLKIGVATENRMNYRFTHSIDNEILRENCLALMGGDNLYSVCASSNTANDDSLASALKNITIQY